MKTFFIVSPRRSQRHDLQPRKSICVAVLVLRPKDHNRQRVPIPRVVKKSTYAAFDPAPMPAPRPNGSTIGATCRPQDSDISDPVRPAPVPSKKFSADGSKYRPAT